MTQDNRDGTLQEIPRLLLELYEIGLIGKPRAERESLLRVTWIGWFLEPSLLAGRAPMHYVIVTESRFGVKSAQV
mgnify:CR=1 FL=1